ncbi:MAG TPA: tetratricopeptide repeat protein [Kiritimatiellia bacterium]|nr:tetratricopeptide repeat protein [Kiritimatiellia bacterium]HRZ11797.1 tetratricopeptide repeat protein [Kiritimatiellia bacterium]HSA17397.1 tetratricopeptide repeat protein [Kiritimatiellia bacterium]
MKITRNELLASAALTLLVFFLYAPAVRFAFVDYDDPIYITENSWVQQGLSAEGFRLSLREWVSGNWHPLTMWTHMLDAELFGLNPAGHHAQSILWHAANTVLLFLLLSRIAGGFWPGLFIAALWAAHPLNADSVAWISERKNLVSTFFWLATIGLYIRFTRRPSPHALMAVIAGFALALMAKPMPVTLPFTLLLLDFWPLRRVEGIGRSAWPTWKKLALEKLPLFVIGAVFILTTLKTQVLAGATGMSSFLSLHARLAWLPIFYLDYLRLFFWPRDLCVLYPAPTAAPSIPASAGALLILLLITAGALVLARRRPWLAAGWFWFLGTLAPVIGLVSVGLHRIADRYLYVPMLGLLLMVVWRLFDAASKRWRPAAFALAAAVVLVLGLVTRHDLPHWRNSEALFRRALAVTRDNYAMHYNLGRQLTLQRKFDEAIAEFREAIRLRPDYALAHNNLGWTLCLRDDNEEALPSFRESLRLMPDNHQARFNLGLALMRLGRYAEAREQLEILLQQAPAYPEAQDVYQQLLKAGRS